MRRLRHRVGAIAGSTGRRQVLVLDQCAEWLIVLLANGVGGGLQVVATFIPDRSFPVPVPLDPGDSGYMARAAS